jgi:hypothetical protein
MKELIPLCAGLVVGGYLAGVRSARLRAILLPVLSVVVGGLASWLNGELESGWWAFFLSFDALVVWLGAVTGFVFVTKVRTRQAEQP